MMNNPLVSVVVPVLNGSQTIGKCLSSLLGQSYVNYEIIVVENGSTDKTSSILEFFVRQEKIRLVEELRKGIGRARRAGEKVARGEIILMTDADCVVPSNWINDMIKPIIKDKFQAVQGQQHDYLKDYQAEVIGRVNTSNFAIIKSALKQIGWSSEKYNRSNDVHLSLMMKRHNIKLAYQGCEVEHLFDWRIFSVVRRNFWSGRECALMASEFSDDIFAKDFLVATNQTPSTFWRFFLGWPKEFVVKNVKEGFYDVAIGLSWRAGLSFTWLKQKLWKNFYR